MIKDIGNHLIKTATAAALLALAAAGWNLWRDVDRAKTTISQFDQRLTALESRLTALDAHTLPGIRSEFEGIVAELDQRALSIAEDSDNSCFMARHYINFLYDLGLSIDSIETALQQELKRARTGGSEVFSREYSARHENHLEKIKNAIEDMEAMKGNARELMADVCQAQLSFLAPSP